MYHNIRIVLYQMISTARAPGASGKARRARELSLQALVLADEGGVGL